MSVCVRILDKIERGCKEETFLLSSCSIYRSLFTFSSERRLHCNFSSFFFKQIHAMFLRLILCKKIANVVFFDAQKVQKIADKVHLCPDV